ncbi:10821_t:CDS:2 [Gigaspora margarita]|uniref:10821_t:CDS:1 n=1 Tax=Gigaspora margarita TaxID=4874 RepID=A0ABN7V1Z8_GIGMA|nr:10821_t:CDS:2 [Gigaspora margarita]
MKRTNYYNREVYSQSQRFGTAETKPPPSIYRNRKLLWKPETCLVNPRKRKLSTFELYYVLDILVEDDNKRSMKEVKDIRNREAKLSLETVLESFINAYYTEVDDLPKGNDKKKRLSSTEEASEELANTNESAKEIGVENHKNKTFNKAYKINQAKEIQVKKDENEMFKDSIECVHINGIGIEQDEEPDIANNLEHACKVWKKKTMRAEEFKRMIRNHYELVQPKKCEIANKEVNLDTEALIKDDDYLIQSLQDLKSEP